MSLIDKEINLNKENSENQTNDVICKECNKK